MIRFRDCSVLLTLTLIALSPFSAQAEEKTRLAVVGLDHDHIWGILKRIAAQPDAELVGIAAPQAELREKAQAQVPASVKFYSEYVPMLDDLKPDAVIVTTANHLHLAILRECARRKIHYFTEKPMAASGADAREMERLARQAGIKLMVNYWQAWAAPTQEAYARLQSGEIGPIQKMIVQYGHQGPREIGVSKYFADWLYDSEKNGAGALMDFGCYGANWALWVKGKPTRVFATAAKLKTSQQNAVEDEAMIILEYPDATVILMPSWNWPYGRGQVEFFGPKGSFLVMGDALLFQPAGREAPASSPQGTPVETKPLAPEKSNGVAHFVYCIRNNKPIEGNISAALNVTVNEIIDAAKESVRTGRAVDLK